MVARNPTPDRLRLAIGIVLLTPVVYADYPSTFELSGLDGSNGFTLQGESAGDGAGMSVAPAGDFNADGIPDIIVGAPRRNTGAEKAGVAYIVYGDGTGFTHPFDLSGLDASSGLVLSGVGFYDYVGASVAAAGDVNGDGFDDVIIGASAASYGGEYSGSAYVLFGSDQALPASLDVTEVDGSNGIAIHSATNNGEFGASVSGAGDINGDGVDDLVIGAPFAGIGGLAYVIFGNDEGLAHPLDLSLLDGSNGFTISAADIADSAGTSVAGMFDFNGDTFDDVVVGAPTAGLVGDAHGSAYIVYGTDQGFSALINVSTLDGNNGIAINGVNPDDDTGQSVALAGDINGDGIDDLLIGAPLADPNGVASGAGYVVFGSDQAMTTPVELSGLDGGDGFVMNGVAAGDNAGSSVGPAGDLDASGTDDLVVGANFAAPHGSESGSAFVVYGKNFGEVWPATIELSALDGASGFTVNGVAANNRAATSVNACGDINGDSYTDLLIGAPGADPEGNDPGSAYLLFGGAVGANPIIFSDGFEQ